MLKPSTDGRFRGDALRPDYPLIEKAMCGIFICRSRFRKQLPGGWSLQYVWEKSRILDTALAFVSSYS